MSNGVANGGVVTELRITDVLLGRGSGPNDHEGNRRFRQMVAERKAEYMATNHRLTKAKIAQEIVDGVYAVNGRFLRKIEGEEAQTMGIPDGVDAWMPATDSTIMEKAKQALRQNASKFKAEEVKSFSTKPTLSATAQLPIQHQPQQLTSLHPGDDRVIPMGRQSHRYVDQNPAGLETTFDEFEPIPYGSSAVAYPKQGGTSRAQESMPAPAEVPQWSNQRGGQIPGQGITPQQWDNHQKLQLAAAAHQQYQQQQQQLQRQQQQSSQPVRRQRQGQSLAAANQAGGNRLGGGSTRRSGNHDSSFSQLPVDVSLDSPNFNFQPPSQTQGSQAQSMTLTDLSAAHSRRKLPSNEDVHTLVDSFSKMKSSTAEEQRKMMASTDTMGTIEQIGAGSVADMSMNSSVFSLYRGESMMTSKEDLVDFIDEKVSAAATAGDQRQALPEAGRPPAAMIAAVDRLPSGFSLASDGRVPSGLMQMPSYQFSAGTISISDASRKKTGLLSSQENVILEGKEGPVDKTISSQTLTSTNTLGLSSRAAQPRPVDLIDEHPNEVNFDNLGSSSMSILKAFASQPEFEGGTAAAAAGTAAAAAAPAQPDSRKY